MLLGQRSEPDDEVGLEWRFGQICFGHETYSSTCKYQ